MRPGLTEEVWNRQLSEDQRIAWGLSIVIISIVVSAFVRQSPYVWFNWMIRLYCGVNAYLLVQSQRKLSALDRRPRRKYMRASLCMAAAGITVIVSCMFGDVLIAISGQVIKNSVVQAISNSSQPILLRVLMPIITVIACVCASLKSYEGFGMKKLAFNLPRATYIQLIVKRAYTARTFLEFAVIELAVVAYSWVFASTASDLANLTRTAFSFF
jgi:hypothetical protein